MNKGKVRWGLVSTLVGIAGMLPVLVWGVTGRGNFSVISRAGEVEPIRIWLEPEAVEVKTGAQFSLAVWGEMDSRNKIVPQVEALVRTEQGLEVGTGQIVYKQPFLGRTRLGEVTLTARQPGEYQVEIVEGSVNTTLPDLMVETGGATVVVK